METWRSPTKLALLAVAHFAFVACAGGGGSSGGGGSQTPPPGPDTSIEITPTSVLLTTTGQTQQLSAVVYRADGTVDKNANVTWTVVDPTAASIQSMGSTATVTALAIPSFTQIVVTSGSLSAQSSLAVAAPAPGTQVLDPSVVVSVSQTQLTLQLTSQTKAIEPGDIVVSTSVLATVETVQTSGGQMLLGVIRAPLTDAFSSFKIPTDGVKSPPPVAYPITISSAGVEMKTADRTIRLAQTENSFTCTGSVAPVLTGGGITFSGLLPAVQFNVLKDSTTGGAVQMTFNASGSPSVSFASPTIVIGASGSATCSITLPADNLLGS